MSQVEVEYDQFLSSIAQQITNADVNLLVRVMYLERKLPDVSPKVDLHMEFKPNVDPMKKQDQYRAKFGFPTQTTDHGLTVSAQMNIDLIEKISKDPDIKYMSGTATPASY